MLGDISQVGVRYDCDSLYALVMISNEAKLVDHCPKTPPSRERRGFDDETGRTAGCLDVRVDRPNTALTLMQLKDEPSTSNRPILGPDATSPTKKSVLGIPLFSAPGCSPNYIWGIPRATSFVVIRLPASVEVDRSVKFTSDQTAVRCVLRVGFGWPHPASVVCIGFGGN